MNLRLEWCDYKSAKWAVEHWHYSGCMPAGKLVKIGVWEDDKFVGCVIFGRGANKNMGSRYSLKQTECCELTRIALRKHKSTVTRIVSIALRMLAKHNPGIKCVVSYADKTNQGHNGTIYRAGNWIYDGLSVCKGVHYRDPDGKIWHARSLNMKYGGVKFFPPHFKKVMLQEKHRFIYPLDREWYNEYTRRKLKSEAAGFHPAEGGATPTPSHHTQ